MAHQSLVRTKSQSRDINLEAAIADELKTSIFYEFNEPALNSFCRDVAPLRNNYRGWTIVRERRIRTTRLSDVIDPHLPQGTSIAFMSIDVEGLDLDVLRSNNWEKFRPAVVLVEDIGPRLRPARERVDEIVAF
jgi:hypothetical protein